MQLDEIRVAPVAGKVVGPLLLLFSRGEGWVQTRASRDWGCGLRCRGGGRGGMVGEGGVGGVAGVVLVVVLACLLETGFWIFEMGVDGRTWMKKVDWCRQ